MIANEETALPLAVVCVPQVFRGMWELQLGLASCLVCISVPVSFPAGGNDDKYSDESASKYHLLHGDCCCAAMDEQAANF